MARNGNYQLRHSQNFLVNKKLVCRLVAEAEFSDRDTVVEIGPGKGIITRMLAEQAGHVIAIEKDEQLASSLLRTAQLPENVTVYVADVMAFPMPSTPYKVFANIPFRHTAAIVGKLTTGVAPPVDARLIVQREAAERFAIGGEATMRAQQLAPFFDVEILHSFHARDFSPSPGVECVLMEIRQKQNPCLPGGTSPRYSQFVEAVYSAWQPTLGNAIKAALPRLAAQSVIADQEIRRYQSLQPSRVPSGVWLRIFKILLERNDPRVWQNLGDQHARQKKNRNQLERPTQSNLRKSGGRR